MSDLQSILNKLGNAKPHLISLYPIKSMAIFGSVSRGEDSAQSDVDILVEFNKPVGIEFIRLAYELEKLLNRKVDLVSRGGIKEKYFKVIESDLMYV